MASKTHYEVLELPATATSEEIKRSFRALIARYHPDKVQHLGKEFQDMAAERAAELTEAYRILSDAGRRGSYDRTLGAAAAAAAQPQAGPAPSAAPPARPAAEQTRTEPAPPPPQPDVEPEPKSDGSPFREERQVRDEYMRKATLSRFRSAVTAVGGAYDEAQLSGFEFAYVPRSSFLNKNKNPRLLGRFLTRVDGPAVSETWTRAGKWTGDDVCVFLLGSSLASARELASAIADSRKRSRTARVTLIPVDARDWTAHVPTDAPDVAKSLLARLRKGT